MLGCRSEEHACPGGSPAALAAVVGLAVPPLRLRGCLCRLSYRPLRLPLGPAAACSRESAAQPLFLSLGADSADSWRARRGFKGRPAVASCRFIGLLGHKTPPSDLGVGRTLTLSSLDGVTWVAARDAGGKVSKCPPASCCSPFTKGC